MHGSRQDVLGYLSFQEGATGLFITPIGWVCAIVGIPLAALGALRVRLLARGKRALT